MILNGHKRKVSGIRFHPTVKNLLASVSADGCAKLWNTEVGKQYYTINPSNISTSSSNDNHLVGNNIFYDHIWNEHGALLITSMKDKSIHFIDSRTSKVPITIQNAHDGGKCIKLVSISMESDYDHILTVGNTKGSIRQVKIWDSRNTKTEVYKLDLDNSSGTIMPFYDRELGLLYLTGKGDGNIRLYELKPNTTELFPLSEFKSSIATKGMAILPRRCLDTNKNEISRLLKLTTSSIEPISFFIPRKASGFQTDLYPDVYSDVPSHSAEQWWQGSNQMPMKVSLAPTYILPLSRANSSHSLLSPTQGVLSNITNNHIVASGVAKFIQKDKDGVHNQSKSGVINLTDEHPALVAELQVKVNKAKRRIFELEARCKKAGLSIR